MILSDDMLTEQLYSYYRQSDEVDLTLEELLAKDEAEKLEQLAREEEARAGNAPAYPAEKRKESIEDLPEPWKDSFALKDVLYHVVIPTVPRPISSGKPSPRDSGRFTKEDDRDVSEETGDLLGFSRGDDGLLSSTSSNNLSREDKMKKMEETLQMISRSTSRRRGLSERSSCYSTSQSYVRVDTARDDPNQLNVEKAYNAMLRRVDKRIRTEMASSQRTVKAV